MPASVTTVCEPESSEVFAASCQSGVYYWEDYGLVGDEWNNYAQIWESLA